MTKGVFSRHFHETREGNYITKKGWVVWRIRQDVAEGLLAAGLVEHDKFIDPNIWKQVENSLEQHVTSWERENCRLHSSVVSRHRELRLTLVTASDNKWKLNLALPATYELLAQHNLTGCGFVVDDRRLSATTLEYGHEIEIDPGTEEFRVEPFGVWSDSIDLSRWVCGAPGLLLDGTVFAWRQSEWRRQGFSNQLVWGEEILIVSARQNLLNLRFYDFRERVGELAGRWIVELLKLPDEPDQSIKRGMQDLFGIAVRDKSPSVELLSPCVEIDGSGVPVYDQGSTIAVMIQMGHSSSEWLIELFHEVDQKQQDDKQHCAWRDVFDGRVARFELGNLGEGSYELVARGNGRASMSFRIAAHERRQISRALEAIVDDLTLSGLTGETHKVKLSRTNSVEIGIEMPSPRDVRWRWTRGLRTNWDAAKTEAASTYITEELREFAISDLDVNELQIDGGPYGRVSILIEREPTASLESQPICLSLKDLNRQRWVRSMLGPASMRGKQPSDFQETASRAVKLTAHLRYLEKLSRRG